MSSVRATGTNRTPETSRLGDTARLDRSSESASFPDALGIASRATAAPADKLPEKSGAPEAAAAPLQALPAKDDKGPDEPTAEPVKGNRLALWDAAAAGMGTLRQAPAPSWGGKVTDRQAAGERKSADNAEATAGPTHASAVGIALTTPDADAARAALAGVPAIPTPSDLPPSEPSRMAVTDSYTPASGIGALVAEVPLQGVPAARGQDRRSPGAESVAEAGPRGHSTRHRRPEAAIGATNAAGYDPAIAPLPADAGRPSGLGSGPVVTAGDVTIQTFSSIAPARGQGTVLTASAAGVADSATDAPPTAGPAISTLAAAFPPPSALAGDAQIDPDPGILPQPAAVAPAPAVRGVVTAPGRSAARSDVPDPMTAIGFAAEGPGLPVAVSASPSASAPSPTGLADQLSYQVVRAAENGGREVVLQLHPPELGDLTVRVQVVGREVSAWFGSPQAEVQQAISQAIGQLHSDLGNAGYTLNSAWVGADAWSQRDRDRSSATPQPPRGMASRPKVEQASSAPSVSAASGVSIYV